MGLHQGGSVHQEELTDRALLIGEQDTAVAAVGVGHADVVPVGPVQFTTETRTHTHTHTHMRTHTHADIHTHTHTQAHTNTHKHTHTELAELPGGIAFSMSEHSSVVS